MTGGWFPVDPAAPGTRLFCLPHAGGSAGGFLRWRRSPTPDIAVVPVRLPGRDGRQGEAPETDFDRLARRLAAALRPWTDRRYALFGHSLGAILAFELARRLDPPPCRLFVSGASAPDEQPTDRWLHTLPDHEFLSALRGFGGLPDDPGLATALLPRLRADCTVAETYRYRAAEPLRCPISVLCGRWDPTVDTSRLERWGAHTDEGVRIRLFPGDHFYLSDAENFVLRAIRKDLAATSDHRGSR